MKGMKREWKGSKSGKNDNEKKLKRVGKKDIGLNKIREMKRIYYKEIWNHTSRVNWMKLRRTIKDNGID